MEASLKLTGIELYCDDLQRARAFYSNVLGLPLAEEDPHRFVQFEATDAFLCLERKGAEDYPSRDKAVIFFETDSLDQAIARIGKDRFVRVDQDSVRPWAVLHDPDGHNVVIAQKG
jgi:catechol 2,3-dioxygenase-like lactoylglutathione lyase family enzyme